MCRVLTALCQPCKDIPRFYSPPAAHPVLLEETAAILTRLLMGVNDPEAGGTASRYLEKTTALGMETAGKTGTTQGGCDRRYIGMTPRLLTGIWMGYDYPARQGGIKGNPCVGIWDELAVICEAVYRGRAVTETFALPDTLVEVELCPLSGKMPNPRCAQGCGGRLTKGWFALGSEPREVCPLHEEPPVTVIPHDPKDPNRIPLLPGDVIPEEPREESQREPEEGTAPGRESPLPWISRWFSRFSRR